MAFSRLAIEVEQSILDKHSTLSQEQLDRMEDMFKIYKTEGFN